ncbi:enoyl-CoA hydratase/isomerase family protein [Ottowia sp.]|uniref:enoyl-CoA hydratase/isomerase family protein n=1 Tax=Ottowia sp. TaxID=1898956 RepID=UPI002624C612|nr:enoyl-CoA hydratase/isomerase family protein [Ottowia sp.]
MYQYLTVSENGPVGEMRLNRPEVRNAFNQELVAEIEAAARWFDQQRHIKIVVVSGEGASFCAGFDLKQFSSAADPAEVRATVDAGRRMVQAVARMRTITVAAVQGHCVGGGVVLMASCDLRLAAESARFSLPETDIGIPLAWGGVPALVREAGALFTADFILTCRRVEAREAQQRGLLTDVVADPDLQGQAQALAERLARHSPLVLEATKAQLVAARQFQCPDVHSYSDAYVLHAALLDHASQQARSHYLAQRKAAP